MHKPPLLHYPTRADFAASAVVAAAFVLVYAALLLFFPASDEQRRAADPLIRLLLPIGGIGVTVLIAALPCAFWLWQPAPGTAARRRALAWAGAGLAAGLLVTLAIRLLHGDTLPAFIPAEESAAPGRALSLGAGVLEEAWFRLVVLPLSFLWLRNPLGNPAAAITACLITGLAFALAHEAGAGAFDAGYFLTRVIVPGIAMSALALLFHPAFVVAAHAGAHLLIPLLFVAAG